MSQYEYVSVALPQATFKTQADYDRLVTEELNKVAKHGWRLVGLIPYNSPVPGQAVFERVKS